MLTPQELKELEIACDTAKTYASAFTEAVKHIAEKHQLDPQGLGRFVRARVADKQDKLEAEKNTVEQLTMLF